MILHESKNMTPMVASIEVKNQTDFQIVYASQLYGTFFAVGAKLELSKDKKKIEKIHLALNNYKGLYNIGMHKDTKNCCSHKNKKALITLNLMVDNGKNTDKIVRSLSIHMTKHIPLTQIEELIFTRVVRSITSVELPEEHLDETIFDSEFYVRNGKYIAAIDRLDSYLPTPDLDDDKKGLVGDRDTNCMNSRVKLIKK